MSYKKPVNNPELSVHEKPAEYSAKTYSIHEAKTNLSKLVKRAAAGEKIYIGSYGKPEVVLTVFNEKKHNAGLRAEAFGCMKGKIELPEGWDDPLPDEIIDLFYNMDGFEEFIKK